MRRSLGIIIIIILSLLSGCVNNESGQGILDEKGLLLEDSLSENVLDLENTLSEKELVLEEIQNEIIRFHVLANSDTKEDQALKIKIRDRVIEEMSSKFNSSNSIDDARKIMLDSIDEVNAIAKEVIEGNGYNYSVRSELSMENFPDKMYGDTLYPQGNYEAFRILIGEANGQNWWCVMFPPLCFVDESKQAVNSNETKENLEKVIDENKDIKGKNEDDKSDKSNSEGKVKEKIKFKFKLLEFFKKN